MTTTMDEQEFEKMREKVESRSVCYNDSKAFRMALYYIERQNPEFYKELIETEYNEAFG